MKLYTEEQVKEVYLEGWNDGQHDNIGYIDRVVYSLTPIELPSDEEIRVNGGYTWVFKTNSMKWSNNDDTAGDNYGSFIAGAKWMKEQILYQNK